MRKFVSLLSVLVLISALAHGQTRTVTGKVTDAQGQPLPFASVISSVIGIGNCSRFEIVMMQP